MNILNTPGNLSAYIEFEEYYDDSSNLFNSIFSMNIGLTYYNNINNYPGLIKVLL